MPLLPHDPRWLLQLQDHTLLPASKKDYKGHVLSLYIYLSVRVRMTQVLDVVWPVLPAVWPRGWLFHLCKHQLSRSRTQCFCLNFINQNLVTKLGSGKTQGWCTGKTQRDGIGREEGGGTGWGTHVNPWLIHVNVWQKPLQYCKVISLQLIKINEKQNKTWFWQGKPENVNYFGEQYVLQVP